MASLSPDKLVPSSNSTDEQWIEYRKALGSYFGRKKANQWFTKTWSLRGGTSVRGNTVALRDYLQSVGLKIETTGVQDVLDFGDDVGDSIGNALNMGKWAGITILAVAIGGVATLIYAIIKKPEILVAATPAGAAASVLKK